MGLRPYLLASSSLVIAAALLPGQARAQLSLGATSTYTAGGNAAGTVTQTTPGATNPDVLPSDNDSSGNSIFGHVYSYQNGSFGSRSSGSNSYSITGTASYSNSFVPTATSPYAFNFSIDNGELFANLQSGVGGAQNASLEAKITETVNSVTTTLFDYLITMSATNPNALAVFTETLNGSTPVTSLLNPGGPLLSNGNGDYSWSPYSSLVLLGTLNAGDHVTVNYDLTSIATGSSSQVIIPGSCGYGYGYGYGYGNCNSSHNGSALARIGDPVGFDNGIPVSSFSGPAAVPEPASALVLGAGLAGLAFMRRRRAA